MRHLRSPLFFILIMMISNTSCKQTAHPGPINPEASTETVNLLDFLYKISGEYTLAGQHNYIGTGSKYTRIMEEMTGRSPVIWGSDFSFCYKGDHPQNFQHCGPLNLTDPSDSVAFTGLSAGDARQGMINEAKRMYADGHIITLMWHCCFPSEGDCCPGESIWAMENRPDDSVWNELVTEGTELNTSWKKQAGDIAGYLAQLRDANIPVLWRPYHEMNGVWFWWCNHQGRNGFKKLWIMMYDYFTVQHKLNNLLWVWDANAPRDIPGDEARDYRLFYPGNQYVDILAADVYRKDYKASHLTSLREIGKGKPAALGEVGELPEADTLAAQPGWIWFMTWAYHSLKHNSPEMYMQIYQSERVLTLDEIVRDEQGRYTVREAGK